MTKKITDQELVGEGTNIIPHPSAAAPSDPLLEELNVVKLEGQYFCFDPREVPRRKGTLEYRDGTRGLKIELHPDYGQPSILAYRILQAAFRKITLEGRPFPDTVAFTYRELSRLIGRDVWGGKDAHDLLRAIKQLQRTVITISLNGAPKNERRWVEFSLIITSGFVTSGETTSPGRIKSAVLTLHPLIIDSMRQGHFVIFNWDRITALSPLSSALYKRLYLHLSNLYENKHSRTSLKFEKDYEAICSEWLGGLKPARYKSDILKQLKPHLEALKATGIVRSYAIEKMAGGNGYKLVFTPGTGFFLDYDLYYHGSKARVLQFQHAADEAQIKAPLELTRYFYQRLYKSEKLASEIFSEKDVQFAETLVRRYGMDESRALVDFTIDGAASTKFAIKNIKAIETYIPAWEANREAREKNVTREKTRALKEQTEKLRSDYDGFLRKYAFDRLEAMSAEERAVINEQATQASTEKYGKRAIGFNMSVTIEEKRIVLDRFPPPSFEEWQNSHR